MQVYKYKQYFGSILYYLYSMYIIHGDESFDLQEIDGTKVNIVVCYLGYYNARIQAFRTRVMCKCTKLH